MSPEIQQEVDTLTIASLEVYAMLSRGEITQEQHDLLINGIKRQMELGETLFLLENRELALIEQ